MSQSDFPNRATQPDAERQLSSQLEATSGFDEARQIDETSAFASGGIAVGTGSSSSVSRSATDVSSRTSQRVIGGFRLGTMLGQGGMGRVFRADDSTGRAVAIKLLSPDLTRSDEALARFKQEGLIASQINHPRCVFVHRVDEDNGVPFIAMELMTGSTLKDLVLERGPLEYPEALRLILQCIEGLIEAHSRGMIHRDIKPANCYLDEDGNVKVGDFGLARSLVSDSELTQTGAFLGTPLFASPEQLIGQEVDARSDIYSLTATLYYLLAGKAPFESPHAAQVIARIASSDPPSLKSNGVEVPEELQRILSQGLARAPEKRFQSFVEMQRDLLALLAPKPQPASLARRVVAAVADMLLMSTLVAVLVLLLIPPSLLASSRLYANALGGVIGFLYFWIVESLFGTSVGKAAMRIRIVDALSGRRASFKQITKRAFAYLVLANAVEWSLLFILLATQRSSPTWDNIAYWFSILVAIGLFYSTWRATGRRQLLHDWMSGTECQITMPSAFHQIDLSLPTWHPQFVEDPAILPAMLGRFRVLGQLAAQTSDDSRLKWYAAEDPRLNRSIWIALSDDPTFEYEHLQSNRPLSNRLRFIEEGNWEDRRWFAYMAPEGIPMTHCVLNASQFPWSVTQHMLRQIIHGRLATNGQQAAHHVPRMDDLWIDRSGRLTEINLKTPCQIAEAELDPSEPPLVESHEHVDGRWGELVRSLCALGLSPRHHARRKFAGREQRRHVGFMQASDMSGPTIQFSRADIDACQRAEPLPPQALPPWRAATLCASITAGDHIPTPQQLAGELDRLQHTSHGITSKARFVNAALSLAFLTPLFFIGWLLLTIPSIIYLMDLRKDVKRLATFETIVNSEEPAEDWWQGVTAEERQNWTDPIGRQRVADSLQAKRNQLQATYRNLGILERTVLAQIPNAQVDLLSPIQYDLRSVSERRQAARDPGQRDLEVTKRTGQVGLILADNEPWSEPHLQATLGLFDDASPGDLDEPSNRSSAYFVWWGLLGCAVWTAVTYGGLARRFTGICFVARDGRRMAFLQSCWRALLLFLPAMLVALAISQWPLIEPTDVWWTTRLKTLFLLLPPIYLATTLISHNRTPLDTLARTTAIPR